MDYDICNTCLLVPVSFTRTECAAWVQAIGSVGAIILGITAIVYQQSKEEARRVEALRLENRNQLNALKWIFLEISNQAQTCLTKLNGEHVRWDIRADEFQELARRIDSMPLSTISDAGLMARVLETSKGLRLIVLMANALGSPRKEEIKSIISSVIAKTKEEALIGVTEVTQLLIKFSSSVELEKDWELIDKRKSNRDMTLEVLSELERARKIED
ncbi:hypothetical protein [Polynucleobacter sphagniphilus]|uniref:hypothetical protein n=1 Tax=Polynucleobacter sphagniphilus TaxID=1743169 RepID=UPI002404F604|nr:hypothetical protein [Polynucleobacter sphagniphilus]MDF9789233.1 hypothetical protein [Polynucleobacter sphagniphilus]